MKPKPGDTVVLIKLPPGKAELRFTTSDGHIHFVYVSPEYISRLSEN